MYEQDSENIHMLVFGIFRRHPRSTCTETPVPDKTPCRSEKAFEAATLETPAKPVAIPAAPVQAAAPALAQTEPAPAKIKTVKAKAKPAAKKAAAPKAVDRKSTRLNSSH